MWPYEFIATKASPIFIYMVLDIIYVLVLQLGRECINNSEFYANIPLQRHTKQQLLCTHPHPWGLSHVGGCGTR